VALGDSVDPARAPIPTNDSERLFFRQHSETLVRLDCRGEVRPGLAAEWTSDSARQRWTFTLRSSAPTLGRAPITAAGMVSSWRDRWGAVQALGIDSAVALDDRRLSVTMRATPDSVPRLFADPALAVSIAGDSGTVLTTRVAPESGKVPMVDFQVVPGGDPRDALDRGADLVVTRDPAVIDYVAKRSEFTTFPLPWSRTYALLQPAGADPIWILGVDSVRRSLARDVAQAEARAADPPFWWSRCPHIDLSYVVPPAISPRIVYRRDDKVARGLAERIVALTRDTIQLRTAGLDPAEFAAALRNQHDRGYVLIFLARLLPPAMSWRPCPRGPGSRP
jgi:hypothetical protein